MNFPFLPNLVSVPIQFPWPNNADVSATHLWVWFSTRRMRCRASTLQVQLQVQGPVDVYMPSYPMPYPIHHAAFQPDAALAVPDAASAVAAVAKHHTVP